jgi:glycosyltransferase involved in cell wall biosynthesis
VGADFVPVDFHLRWHDRQTRRAYRYLSWATCALRFPRRGEYDVFLTDGPHIPPLILKQLGLLRTNQRVAALLASEMLYFLKAGRYTERSTRAILAALERFDALVCLGSYQTELAQELLDGRIRKPRIWTGQEGIFDKVRACVSTVRPRLDGNRLVFIGNQNAGWGTFYKGLDLLLDTFALAAERRPELTLDIVGDWNSDTERSLRDRLGKHTTNVRFLGRLTDLREPLSQAALCVHLARGDASPISVVEAMVAGLPALVSVETGRRDDAARVHNRLVVPLDAVTAAERILWYLDLDSREKYRLSQRAREVAAFYSEDNAVSTFQSIIDQLRSA